MADIWKSIFNGTIEGRSVEIEIYDDGDYPNYRVRTTQGEVDLGSLQNDDDSSTMLFPLLAEQGSSIDIEGETPEEILKDLLLEGFSEAAANEIVGKFPVIT